MNYGLVKKSGDDTSKVKAVALDDDMGLISSSLKLLRSSFPDTKEIELEAVNSKFGYVFNKSFKAITGLNETFHNARDIYADMAFNKHGKNEDEETYKAILLGHQAPTISATKYYMGTKVI